MAKSSEDFLIDDDISVEKFSGTLAFVRDTGSNPNLCQDVNHCTVSSESPEHRISRPGPVSIQFEVIDARIDRDEHSKYVVYTVLVMRSDGMDSSPAKVERRYSDFSRLNVSLRHRYPSMMHDISFPPKLLSGNYRPETIARRSRAFEQYLSNIFAISTLRTSSELGEFFFGESLRDGYRHILDRSYVNALTPLRSAWRLQSKLLGDSHPEAIATLCAVVVVHIALEDDLAACTHAERALECFGNVDTDSVDRHFVPLLHSAVRLSWKLGRDKRRLESKFEELRRRGIDVENLPTLMELVVNRFGGYP